MKASLLKKINHMERYENILFTEERLYVRQLERRIDQNIVVQPVSMLFSCLLY
jgi:hypothetical protein